MENEDKIYAMLINNIDYAMKRFEIAEKKFVEGRVLLKGAQQVAEQMRKKAEEK